MQQSWYNIKVSFGAVKVRLCPDCFQRTRKRICPNCQVATIEDTTREGVIERILKAIGLARDYDDLIGKVIDGRYKVLELVGVGGMGEVYRAIHVGTKHEVALKVMKPELAGQEEFVRRFFHEARAVSGLNHPNIVKVSDFGQIKGGRLYLAMEYLRGRSLRSEFVSPNQGQFRGMDPLRAIRIAIEVAKALGAAHQAGIVHRDLKPENIYIIPQDDEELVKVVDFGISKIADASGTTLTSAGIFLGTPAYASPEQARGKKLDGRSDLYALGVVLYEMLCGFTPFSGRDKIATLVAQINEPPPKLLSHETEYPIPIALAEIVHKLLRKDPEDRYPSARHLIRALNDVLTSMTEFDPEKTIPLKIRPSDVGIFESQSEPPEQEKTIAVDGLDDPEKTLVVSGKSPIISDAKTPANYTIAPYPTKAEEYKKIWAALLGGVAGALFVFLLFIFIRSDTEKQGVLPQDLEIKEDIVNIVSKDTVETFVETTEETQGEPKICKLMVTSIPNNAMVFIDGSLRGVTPLTYKVSCQSIPTKITLQKQGYMKKEVFVPKYQGETTEILVDGILKKIQTPRKTKCPKGLIWDASEEICIVPPLVH